MLALILALMMNVTVADIKANERGNGGDVVVCQDSVELLDFYEARVMRDITIDEAYLDQTPLKIVDSVLERYRSYDPERMTIYQKKTATFFDEAKFIPGIVLTDIPDSSHLGIPMGCNIQQIAIQKRPEYPEDRPYLINQDLWNRLSNVGKAGLILHEVVYSHAIVHYAHQNSMAVRYLVSKLFSNKMSKYDYIRTLAVAKHIKYPPSEYIRYHTFLAGTKGHLWLVLDGKGERFSAFNQVEAKKICNKMPFSARLPTLEEVKDSPELVEVVAQQISLFWWTDTLTSDAHGKTLPMVYFLKRKSDAEFSFSNYDFRANSDGSNELFGTVCLIDTN